jgi:DNA-binding MarR family transcriptional regulator
LRATLDRVQATSPDNATTVAAGTPKAAAADVPSSPEDLARDFYATVFTLNLRVMRDLFQRLTDLGLSPTQFKILHRLLQQRDGEADLSVKALGDHHCLSLAAASRAIDGLFQHGYVERDECPTDRRVKRVRITAAGRAVLGQVHAANIELLTEFTQTLTETERQDLATAIAPLMAKLDIRAAMEGPTT